MTDLGGIVVSARLHTHREGGTEDPADSPNEDQSTRDRKNASSREHKNSSDVDDSGNDPSPGQNRGNPKVDGNEPKGPASDLKKQDVDSPGEDLRTKFYERYRKEADEYDKEFMKKYEDDLDTTLIFAGLFSAVTSAFIVEVNSELQPDPNQETAALLRVILYNMNKTTFGNDVPTIPQWTGPPPAIVQVQAILYASLAASLFSAFLATLGKQWLNRYESVDMRGSAIERSQNRQWKLDGINSWYFDHVMELLPLMLQAALLLLGCALSRYLWEIDTTVASVALGVTSLGVLFYLFIIVAGAAFVSCPYQTPGAHILRHIPDTLRRIMGIFRHIPDTFRRIPHNLGVLHSILYNNVATYGIPIEAWNRLKEGHYSPRNIATSLLLVLLLPIYPILDTCRVVFLLFAVPSRWVHLRLQRALERQAMFDQHCISWTLRTSLDSPVRLLALDYLATTTSTNFDPTLVADCFDVLFCCITVDDYEVRITQGFEQLATVSAICCLHILPHLVTTDPAQGILEDSRQRFTRVLPQGTYIYDLPVLGVIHTIFHSRSPPYRRWCIWWEDYKPSRNEHIVVAHALAKISRFEYRRRRHERVSRWLLHFALHSLSQSPLPPTSVIINCLTIIAIDLGYNSPTTGTLDESAQLNQVSRWITQELEKMAEDADPNQIFRKRKAISALIPYAVCVARRDGQQQMVNGFLRVARASNQNSGEFIWHRVGRYITPLFNKPMTPSSNSVIILASSHVHWLGQLDETVVTGWAAVASETPYTEEIGQKVVDTLLRIAYFDSLRPHIPVGIWTLLKKQPSLPPICLGRSKGIQGRVVRHVRALGDIEILKSYFLVVWSEWDPIEYYVGPSTQRRYGGLREMRTTIQKDFGGIGVGRHREDLINRLDYILGQLHLGLEYLKPRKPSLEDNSVQEAKEQYGELKKLLLEVEGKAVNILTQSHSTFVCALPPQCL